MKRPVLRTLLLHALLASLVATNASGQDAKSEEAAIRERAGAYAEAFKKGDATALAGFWAPDATWTDPRTGENIIGRDKIRAGFEELLEENEGARLELELHSVKLISDGVALEEGTATISVPGESPSKSGYTAVQVKKDGQWLIERVIETTDAEAATPPKAGETPEEKHPLDEIAWLEGTWVDESDSSSVYYDNEWVAGGAFLRRIFTVAIEDRIDITGMEIVGWDAAAKQIRSWVFDSHGGFAELKWRRNEEDPNKWTKSAHGTLSDGALVSAVHVMKKIDDDNYTFEAVAREVDGKLLPNIDEVTVTRAADAP